MEEESNGTEYFKDFFLKKIQLVLKIFYGEICKCMICNENYTTSLLQKTSVTTISALTTVLQPLVVWLADIVTDVFHIFCQTDE